MRIKHMLIIGSIFPVLFSLVLFFGVLISAEDDDGGSGSSSTVTGMNPVSYTHLPFKGYSDSFSDLRADGQTC